MKKQLSFSNIKLKDLRAIIPLKAKSLPTIFDKWFKFDYSLSAADEDFLNGLLKSNEIRMPFYSEEELKMKFIAPILNRVNFNFEEVTDWYERAISGTVNDWELRGVTDYLVATGISVPERPYFFIQEFKPSKTGSDPEDQLLAELLLAIHLNKENIALGSIIIRQLWTFMLLEKNSEDSYCFYKSAGFNTLNIKDLKQLYIALQGVKADIVERAKTAQ